MLGRGARYGLGVIIGDTLRGRILGHRGFFPGYSTEMRYYGDFLAHDERYERTDEFLTICRRFWSGESPITFTGRHYVLENGRLNTPFVSDERASPEIFLGGNSSSASRLATKANATATGVQYPSGESEVLLRVPRYEFHWQQTYYLAEPRLLPKGTAYITDAGMTGPHDSVIGVRAELAIERMRTAMPVRFHPAEGGVRIEGAVIECDAEGRATRCEPLRVLVD